MIKKNILLLEGEIQAHSQWIDNPRKQIISMEDLEPILSKYIGEKINLKIE